MEIVKPIKSEQEYDVALARLEGIFDAEPNTPKGDLFEVLSLVVHEYEKKHHQMEALTPLEAIRCEMEERGLTQSNLASSFGVSKSAISQILNGKKQMSLRFMKFLHKDLGIPADILLA